MTELLIRGGLVIDGTGSIGRRADVLVRSGVIVAVGEGINASDAEVIDASGAYVVPGFIDSHTHFDPTLFWDPLLEMAQHGVTTVLIGNCSLGLAPLRPTDRAGLSDLFSFIEDIPRDLFDTLVPWDWETYAEYLASVDRCNLVVNVAALVGQSMLRQYVMGDDAWQRAATPAEIDRIGEELERALDAGACGMSTSFFDKDAHGRPVPTVFAADAEFDTLFAILGRHKAFCQIIPKHPEVADMCANFERLGLFAARHQVPLLSNQIGDFPMSPALVPAFLASSRALRAKGADLYHMLSPRSIELAVNFHQTFTFMAMPVWNELIQTPLADKPGRLNDPVWRARARTEWDTVKSFMFPTDHLDRIRIIEANGGPQEAWVGRTLAALVAERGGHPSDVLADWLIENELETQFVVPMNNFDPHKVGELAQQPEVLISGSDAGAHGRMFCGVGDTTLVLTRHVREHRHLTLEQAVHKMTAQQAKLIGLSDRGLIAPGKVADIAIFALDELKWEAEEMQEDPAGGFLRFVRPPGGFRYTLIGGIVVQQGGCDTGQRPARLLRAPATAASAPGSRFEALAL